MSYINDLQVAKARLKRAHFDAFLRSDKGRTLLDDAARELALLKEDVRAARLTSDPGNSWSYGSPILCKNGEYYFPELDGYREIAQEGLTGSSAVTVAISPGYYREGAYPANKGIANLLTLAPLLDKLTENLRCLASASLGGIVSFLMLLIWQLIAFSGHSWSQLFLWLCSAFVATALSWFVYRRFAAEQMSRTELSASLQILTQGPVNNADDWAVMARSSAPRRRGIDYISSVLAFVIGIFFPETSAGLFALVAVICLVLALIGCVTFQASDDQRIQRIVAMARTSRTSVWTTFLACIDPRSRASANTVRAMLANCGNEIKTLEDLTIDRVIPL